VDMLGAACVVQPALGPTYPGVVLFAGVASTVKTKGHMVTIPPGKWWRGDTIVSGTHSY
jgi:hypothetical protein